MGVVKSDLEAVIQEVRSAASHLRGADAESWATRLDRDHDRIEQALDWLLKNEPTSGLELALALPDYWHLRGRWAEGETGSSGFSLRYQLLRPPYAAAP